MCNEKELVDIRSFNLIELTDYVTGDLGEPKFRAKQLYEWMHQHLALDYDEMKNIPKSLKEKLLARCNYHNLEQIDLQISKIDATRKYLFRLYDGEMVESVWMSYKHGNSVCISSQVGCKMGCRFCASTLDGWVRNLTPSEMLGQIYAIQRDTGERVSNVVVMGTGEPMDNYDNIVKFVRLLSDENGLNISQRNITVSTCGIVPKIKQLAEEDLTITLAISLHAPNQAKRAELMPIANKYDIHELIDACQYYFEKTGRRITFEYSLVGGVNDRDEDAKELGELIGHLNCHVNLIPVNPIKERDFVSPSMDRAYAFQKKIEKYVNNATIRREMGRDIDGACGQLRKRKMDASKGTI
ncbi:MAG: 23S rRNA (adenine(2503)-C(2))-methyltransferase RlmN [Pseudobutyrivibrio sp.]|jgi:23S rRNA (adenine2503-C2)-methyltransferase|uniref:23S rRNA (adenine(2503)-C(2))-methyltransferase RlmN n=1 Tax=Pseudobutyrivibrio sp. TaxID=2014367 RepID=UPI0025E64583|nr:23S rRNA (adenine(2503)-C(2))-methyltransferase RlmN [Pseudobutyrivibrio sp.]MBE5903112.1 23S rRNA (adenine(2503)-C(2))-methyltransferase RlmN [Pseudobutyrivibrio sp.]